jgi:hypothetical protein
MTKTVYARELLYGHRCCRVSVVDYAAYVLGQSPSLEIILRPSSLLVRRRDERKTRMVYLSWDQQETFSAKYSTRIPTVTELSSRILSRMLTWYRASLIEPLTRRKSESATTTSWPNWNYWHHATPWRWGESQYPHSGLRSE